MQLVSYDNAINIVSLLPGIGRKGASKVVQGLIDNPSLRDDLISSISALEIIHECEICGSLTENEGDCDICISPNRDRKICVVYGNSDMLAVEEAGYNGLYHIMDKLVDPNESVSISDTNISKLIDRVDDIDELIIALPHHQEGKMTAEFIRLVVEQYFLNSGVEMELKITRNATGIESSETLSYSTVSAVSDSLANRRELR